MDTVTLVENQVDDGQILLDRLAAGGVVVRAAWWVKPAEEDRWSLYVITPILEENGPIAAYGKVNAVRRSIGDIQITSSDIKLLGEKDSIAKQMLNVQRHLPEGVLARSPRDLFGGIPIEEVYVYPLGKTKLPIYGMFFRGEPSGALHLSFEPHNEQSTLVVESGFNRVEYTAGTSIDWIEAPAGSTLEADSAGQMELVWNLHGGRRHSNAHEAWSLAKIGLHGFRFLGELATVEK